MPLEPKEVSLLDEATVCALTDLLYKSTDQGGGVFKSEYITVENFFAELLGRHIATGTYTGDGTTSQAITGVGFTPKFIKVWQQVLTTNATIASYETTDTIIDDNVEGQSINMSNGKTKTNAIISLDADGFTVDDDAGPGGGTHPNNLGTVYNYFAAG